jgi:hypothetical protein
MSEENVTWLRVAPGVERDGTQQDSTHYIDAQHVRFYRGRPRKMAGWRRITDALTGPITAVNMWAQSTLNSINTFSTEKIEAILTDKEGVGASIVDRTPVGFTTDERLVWSTDVLFDAAAGSPQAVILAHGAYSAADIEDQNETAVYIGDAIGTGVYVDSGATTSGGVLATHPFAVLYGSNGLVEWSNENEPFNYTTGSAGSARVTANKIVAGARMPSGNGPGALLVSLDAVVAMSYVGGSAIFRFTEISTDSTILSSRSLVAYGGKFYWPGTDQFLVSDGNTVEPLVNQYNENWFYTNLNYAQRQKVWGVAVSKFGEIWWHFPFGQDAVECNHVIIYNVREKIWYDTELSRGAGMRARVFRYPVMASSEANDLGTYSLYTHEFGVDAVEGDNVLPIEATIETCDIGFINGGMNPASPTNPNLNTRITRVEPDFVCTGALTMEVCGQATANSPAVTSRVYNVSSDVEVVDLRDQFRHLRLKFSCGESGGFFEGGKILLHMEPGDKRL